MNPTKELQQQQQQQQRPVATKSNKSGDESKRLYITHVGAFGPYLKIFGQLNRDAVAAVHAKMQQLLPTCTVIDANNWQTMTQKPMFQPGSLCLYKHKNAVTVAIAPNEADVFRTRIVSIMGGAGNSKNTDGALGGSHIMQVEVEFVDYGFNAVVASNELLFPRHPEMMVQNIPTICSQFIALGVCKDWKKSELDEITRMIKHQTLEICIQMEFNQFKFITMKWKEFNFAEFLIHQKKIGAPIANDLLRDHFIKMVKQQQQQQQQQPQAQQQKNTTSTNNHKANNNYYSLTNNNANNTGGNNNGNSNSNTNNAASNTVNNNNTTLASHLPNRYANNSIAVGAGRGGASHIREQMAAQRSLAARLQQQQQQQQQQQLQQQQLSLQMQQNLLMHTVQPRMPTTVGNLRSMMQGIHVQNNRVPYGHIQRPVFVPFADSLSSRSLMGSAAASYSVYNARYPYQVPSIQPIMLALYNGSGSSSSTGSGSGAPVNRASSSPTRTTSATFKSNNLTVGHGYDVCVSFVENGPCLFSVQLSAAQDELTEMMNRIERVQLKQFGEKPVLGTACIARYSEDGQLYRALITGVQATCCKVAYIDYGNAELVNFRDLYIIPEEFLQAKAYAIRFTLSGHKELEPIDESLKKAFKDLVIYKKFKLKVMPLEGPPLVQYCELYSQDKNILEVLKQIQKCRLVYAKAEPLKNNDIVEIRYIDSPKHFYVQKVSNIAEFEQLMDDMFLYYNKNQQVPNHLTLGAPCIVKYENEWYRAEVMRADATAIIVRHVDFGYEQKVTKNLLSNIAEKHLKLPRQAVQCCLKGFENNELNKDLATTQFEMLAEESNRKRRSFTVKVFRIQPDGVNLVNLCTKDLNVMKKLYKLSMPFEKYLTLEKEEFNMHNGHHERYASAAENGHKTPSIASSSDATSIHSGKKAQFVNSTPVLSDASSPSQLIQQQYQLQQQQPKQKSPQQLLRVNNNNTSQVSFSTEWDKTSSASSNRDNRDSRSSSSEHKQSKRQQQQQQQMPQQQRQGKNAINVSANNFSDRRSTGSGSSANANAPNKSRATGGANVPPRFQQENRRQKQQQQNSPPQQRGQRPQNAPQGYSQQRSPKSAVALNRSNDEQNLVTEQPSTLAEEPKIPEEYVALDHAFPCQPIEVPAREEVTICWWISPHQFYTHLKTRSSEFENLMRDMQQFYKRKNPQQLQLKVGCYVVARNRRDNIVYRARILACNQMLRKYKVHFVDFGNQYTVTSEDIWQVEKRFAALPCMANLCSFSGIVSNFDHLYIIDQMEKYLPSGAALVCEYFEHSGNMYYVNVMVNNVSLKDTLIAQGIITEVAPELRLDLLGGQQIRARICNIKDMLNFKIQIEGLDEKVRLLCSYDDVRYVKSNPDIAQKFKQFYENKSFVVNVKDVNDNKVVLLRPLMPLLKDDIPTHISMYPIILDSFEANVVYVVSSYRLYAHAVSNEQKIAELLDEMYKYYENSGACLDNFETDQICAAKSNDGNWYRARITQPTLNEKIEVYYIDYGNKENLEKSKLKKLEEMFYIDKSAYSLEINLAVRPLGEKGRNKQKSGAQEPNENDAAVAKLLSELLFKQSIKVHALEVRNNRLIADVILPHMGNKNVLDVLKEKQLIKGRDVEYMKKQLDKEKPNMLEYIEMVDLTLEDEEDTPDKSKQINKSKTSSPKKKKPVKTEEKPKEEEPAASAKTANITVESASSITELSKTKKSNEIKEITNAASLSPGKQQESPKVTSNVDSSTQQAVAATEIETPTAAVESRPESVVDPYADMEHAILSHCDNPAQFFVHPQEKLEELRKLQENLQIVASSLPPLMRVINGAHCISLYSVDKQWYRAKIMDAELMVLQFIDYGNTDCVSDTTDVKEMSVFPDIEPLCMPCALPIKPNGTADWVDAANAIFNDSYSKVLNYEYITHGDSQKRSYINLYIEGVNIAEKLIQDGFAKPLEVVNSGENCYISHVNGLTDFYIQYEKDSKALELIEIYLADNSKLKTLEKFERSKIVAALFPDDEMWYRAKLLKEVPNKGYEVLFIDYGNTSISPECREISASIAKLPPLSKKCALELPEICLSWSDAAEEKFAEIAALGETIFTVELREPAVDHAIVHLLIDGHNINDDLESLCEHKPLPASASTSLNASFCNTTLHTSICESGTLYDGIISHVNSPLDFYIQFKKDTIRLEDITNSLNTLGMDSIEVPELGQICAARFADDNAFYRARVLEVTDANESKQCRVVFIDYGNEEISSDLRVLPHDLQEMRDFSKHCQLEGAHRAMQLRGMAIDTFNALIDGCQGLVKIDFLDNDSEPALVKLYAANTDENLGEKLNSLLGVDKLEEIASPLTAMTSTPTAEAVAVAVAAATTESQADTCLISHAVSPTLFYIQRKANSPKMELIAKTLKKSNVEKMLTLSMAVLDSICCVFSVEDDCYYRGRVKQIFGGDGGYEILLVDYGNCLVTKELFELPAELRAIPALALKCRLNDVPKATEAVLEERFAALLEAHFGEIYEIESNDYDKELGIHTVKLQVNYKDLAEELRNAVESDATPEGSFNTQPVLHDCTIIHVNSPGSFYIQLTADVASLEKITDVLLDAEKDFEPLSLEEVHVGDVCAAQFPEDSVFYRAKIVQVLDGGKCEVHYLDFGNNSMSEQFRRLPESMQHTERYSKHCALEGNFNSLEACTHFQSLIDSRFSETFQVELLKVSDELNICRLFYQDKNVANELTHLLKNAVDDSWNAPSTIPISETSTTTTSSENPSNENETSAADIDAKIKAQQ